MKKTAKIVMAYFKTLAIWGTILTIPFAAAIQGVCIMNGGSQNKCVEASFSGVFLAFAIAQMIAWGKAISINFNEIQTKN